ncbi:hypothetical protein [Cryptosporangium arvum]|uniref:hypothetical protein n=1 Tax=Cryptosporangium arvum TaxID=80871 RepID=UPI0004B1B19D|nr:hypothetical protein [Cryptosporangium arvum]
MAEPFVPGLVLSARLWAEHVAPLLAAHFPATPLAAALLGAGSEVLGFDTARSTDHDWGPRLQLFLAEDDRAALGADISAMLSERLPKEVLGYPTHLVTVDGSSAHSAPRSPTPRSGNSRSSV